MGTICFWRGPFWRGPFYKYRGPYKIWITPFSRGKLGRNPIIEPSMARRGYHIAYILRLAFRQSGLFNTPIEVIFTQEY
jgi:hypothetical protein